MSSNYDDIRPMDMPSLEEIKRWLLDTVRHAYHIEYYLERLQVGSEDPQRPHDICGVGNKFEWKCIRGFAMQYRKVPEYRIRFVQPALKHHRCQLHHQCWNEYNKDATPDAMRLGAVDAVCSLLEPREYQNGCHTFEEISDIAENNPIHKVAWMHLVIPEMEKIEKPSLSEVTLESAPKKGIDVVMRDLILDRVEDTKQMLKRDHGIEL